MKMPDESLPAAVFMALYCMQRGIGDHKSIRPFVRLSDRLSNA